VVGSGEPKGTVSAHSLVADENVLESVVKGVSHVELTRDVGRRDNDGIGRLGLVDYGCEILFVTPILVYALLEFRGSICLWKLVHLYNSF
jgi:hypothetical protein